MATSIIQLEVDAEVAGRFARFTPAERAAYSEIFSVFLRAGRSRSEAIQVLSSVMDRISDAAEERGLTEERLKAILGES